MEGKEESARKVTQDEESSRGCVEFESALLYAVSPPGLLVESESAPLSVGSYDAAG